MKRLYVIEVSWSATDKDTIIVQETCLNTAIARAKSVYPNAKVFDLLRVVSQDSFIA